MSEKIRIIPAQPGETEIFLEIIRESAGEFISALLGPKAFEKVLPALFLKSGNLFSYRYTHYLQIGGEVAGGILAYSWGDKRRWELSTGFFLAKELGGRFLLDLPKFLRASRAVGYVRKGEFYISNLAVFQKFRGRGMGKSLVEWSFQRAAEEGCSRVVLDAEVENRPAIQLYQKLGFRAESESDIELDGRKFRFYRMVYPLSI